MAITSPPTPFELVSETDKEVVANALGVYIDYLTQIGSGVMEKEDDEGTRESVREVVGGTIRDTVALRQRLVKHVGFDPTYES